MKIAIDAMGGDNAPQAIVEGSIQAVREYGVTVFLFGIENEILKYIPEDMKNDTKIKIIDAPEVILTEDSPVKAIKQKKNSSMVMGLKAVKEKDCDAFLSAGSTGAFLAGSLLKVGRIKGIDRPALAPILPTINGGGCMIIDGGANTDCKAKNLLQFATLGSVYMEKVAKIKKPKVGLLNIGTEEAKGNDLVKETYPLLKGMQNINFVGNIEARDVVDYACDVLVTDGFAGNILLKSVEGTALTIFKALKKEMTSNFKSKVGALLLKSSLQGFKRKFDYTEVGGAPFLGIDGIMIKAHGSSDAKAIKNAIRQAKLLHDCDYLNIVKSEIKNLGGKSIE